MAEKKMTRRRPRAIRRALLPLAVALTTLFTVSSSPRQDAPGRLDEAESQAVVDGLVALHAIEMPDHLAVENPRRDGSEFDVNDSFRVLNRLSVEPGWTLDWVYRFDGLGGGPALYARRENDAPFADFAQYEAAGIEPGAYLDRVVLDGTPESYFQFAVFATLGSQFYMFWHANYSHVDLIASAERLRAMVSEPTVFNQRLPASVALRARGLDPAPLVRLTADTVEVSLLAFTNWGGFLRQIYSIARNAPHRILDVRSTTLVEYQCGVLF